MEKGLKQALHVVRENLETIRRSLVRCIEEGMLDIEAEHYNRLLALIADDQVINSWDELEELIDQSKILEQEVDAWLSLHGRTSFSLSWPKID